MSDDLVERVARLYEDKWAVRDHGLARAAIALALEEAARAADDHRLPLGDFRAPYKIAAAIRAMIIKN